MNKIKKSLLLKLVTLVAASLALISIPAFADETLSTYFPSPDGDFRNLNADTLAVAGTATATGLITAGIVKIQIKNSAADEVGAQPGEMWLRSDIG